jgi:RimJ/RimL family protein N-acetyltransferase
MMWLLPDKNKILFGKYCRLEPLQLSHVAGLFELLQIPDAAERYRFLKTLPKGNITEEEHLLWLGPSFDSVNPFWYVVIDTSNEKNEVVGRCVLRSVTEHGRIEMGGVLWGPGMAKTRIATEALFLIASYLFEELNYRRFEWKCNTDNTASKRAAERYGFRFEGISRQHMMLNGENRDTAWFSILDKEWSMLSKAYEDWLHESNFKGDFHQQIHSLQCFQDMYCKLT